MFTFWNQDFDIRKAFTKLEGYFDGNMSLNCLNT